jgi:hypothetical protein
MIRVLAGFLLTAFEASAADFRELSMRIKGGEMLSAIALPDVFKPVETRPLVALHPGGARIRYYNRHRTAVAGLGRCGGLKR